MSFTETSTVVAATPSEAGFVADDDPHLLASSIAVGAGTSVAEVLVDLDGYPRATPPAAGAFEYHDPSVDAGVIGFDAGAPSGGRDGGTSMGGGDGGRDGGGSDDGGCGCRVAPRAHDAAPWAPALAFVMLALVGSTRRRHQG